MQQQSVIRNVENIARKAKNKTPQNLFRGVDPAIIRDELDAAGYPPFATARPAYRCGGF